MNGIIVFIKNPELGKVKTRLAFDVGDHKALQIYLRLLDYTRSVLLEVSEARRYVFYSDFVNPDDGWSNDYFLKEVQFQGDLGERIYHAMELAFLHCNKVLIIGSDCPQLTKDHIQEAYLKLDSNDVVIGPSLDGGYYLIGMNYFHPILFQDIPWSTDKVLSITNDKAKSIGLSVSHLEPLSDIDYLEDWNQYGFKD